MLAAVTAAAPLSYAVVGDAIPAPLGEAAGDPVRGRTIVVDRQVGLCLLCHTGPFPEQKLQGTLAPTLAGAGSRWTAGQLRLRIVDSSLLDPDTIMPSYYRTEGLTRVAPSFAGKPVMSAEQIEDVVAFLATLRD
jgi:sulfur-oxidizing protein SoxX